MFCVESVHALKYLFKNKRTSGLVGFFNEGESICVMSWILLHGPQQNITILVKLHGMEKPLLQGP